MSLIEEVKENWARQNYGTSFQEMNDAIGISQYDLDGICKNLAESIIKQTKELCSKNAKIITRSTSGLKIPIVDDRSILSDINNPKY